MINQNWARECNNFIGLIMTEAPCMILSEICILIRDIPRIKKQSSMIKQNLAQWRNQNLGHFTPIPPTPHDAPTKSAFNPL